MGRSCMCILVVEECCFYGSLWDRWLLGSVSFGRNEGWGIMHCMLANSTTRLCVSGICKGLKILRAGVLRLLAFVVLGGVAHRQAAT
jgi:hypothetical protein